MNTELIAKGSGSEGVFGGELEASAKLDSCAGIYLFLSIVYRKELDATLVEKLAAHGVWSSLRQAGFELDVDRLRDPDYLVSLRQDYSRVFMGPGKHLSPYGSVHHPKDSKRGQLWGDSTVWVKRFAADHGLRFDGEGYDGIPDHISHELELLFRLVEQEARCIEDGDATKAERLLNSQRHLFNHQLNQWVPSFCDQLCKMTSQPFYQAVARFTKSFLAIEAIRLAPAPGQ